MDAGEDFGREAHGDFELIVAFEDIRVVFPAAEGFPIDESFRPGEVAMDGDWIITAMDHAVDERFAEALGNVATTDGAIEGADIAVKILEAFGHANKDVEVVGIEETTFGGAMSGDGGDAAFEGQGKDSGIGVFGFYDRQRVLAAGVGKERQFGFGHAFPEFGEATIVAVDVVAVGKDFHYGCAAGQASVEFFKGIRSGGVDRDGWNEFGMFLRQIQDVIVWDIMGADVFHFPTLVIVNFVLREDDYCAKGRSAHEVQ